MKIYSIKEEPKAFERIFSDVHETTLDIEEISGTLLPYDKEVVVMHILHEVQPHLGNKFIIEVGECEDMNQDIFIQECIAALRDPSTYFEKIRAKK